jgi:hypothetical protein
MQHIIGQRKAESAMSLGTVYNAGRYNNNDINNNNNNNNNI